MTSPAGNPLYSGRGELTRPEPTLPAPRDPPAPGEAEEIFPAEELMLIRLTILAIAFLVAFTMLWAPLEHLIRGVL